MAVEDAKTIVKAKTSRKPMVGTAKMIIKLLEAKKKTTKIVEHLLNSEIVS